MIWRDDWDGTPNVVILAEEDAQDGVIEDPVLFLLQGITGPVTVTDAEGNRLRVHLPDPPPGDSGMYPTPDLTVEPINEEPKTDPDHPLP